MVAHGGTGTRLDGRWFCSSPCLELGALERLHERRPAHVGYPRAAPPLRVGSLLVHQRAVSQSSLKNALRGQSSTRLPLGRQLLEMGLASPRAVLQALAVQAGVSYLAGFDPSHVRLASGPLSWVVLPALGLVPIETDSAARRVRVACVAPVPWSAVHAVRDVTGWSVEAFLVADGTWGDLLAACDPGCDEGRALGARATRVSGLAEVAAQVAAVARERRARAISVARCDPYVWLRLETKPRPDDMLFLTSPDTPLGPHDEEAVCLAASM